MKITALLRSKYALLGLLLAFFASSCEEESIDSKTEAITNKSDDTILQIIFDTENTSNTQNTIESSSVGGRLSDDTLGTHTFFCATNAAWEIFFNESVEYNSVIEDLTTGERLDLVNLLVSYHLVEGTFLTEDLQDGLVLESVSGQTFSIIDTGSVLLLEDNLTFPFNSSDELPSIIASDFEASNGVVHFIDRLLIPEGFLQTMARRIIERRDTSIFEEAMIKTGLLETFRNMTRGDAFVSTDAAWEECFQLLGNDFNSIDDFDTEEELNLLREIVLEHLKGISLESGSSGFSTSVNPIQDVTGFRFVQRPRFSFPFGIKDGTGLIAEFNEVDIEAENRSSVHIINKVLLPISVTDFILEYHQEALLSFLMNIDDIQNLFDLRDNPNVVIPSFITNGSPFTLLLPTRGAFMSWASGFGGFDSLDDFNSQEGREILANVLAYHFILGETLTTDNFIEGQDYVTLQGEAFSFARTGDTVTIVDSNGNAAAQIVNSDNNAAGGILHIIDTVLLPQELEFYLP